MQLDDYRGEVLNQLIAGQTVRVDSVNERTSEPAYAAIAAVGVQALLSVPLIVYGRLVVNVSIHQHEARHWSDDEVALVQEVAERLWAEVVRSRSEAALAASESKYRSLFLTMGQGYCELKLLRDAAGRAVDQLYLEFNPAFERLFGIPVAKAKGRKASQVFPGSDYSRWTETFDRVARTGKPERLEHTFGSPARWYEVIVYPADDDRVVMLYDEITERKQAEVDLKANQARQAFLLKFSDALRAEPDADATANCALSMLIEQLRLDRGCIMVYKPEADRANVTHQMGNDRVPLLPESLVLSDFPEGYRAVLEGTFVIDDDFLRQGLSEAERAASAKFGMRAMVASTMRRGERTPLASLVVFAAEPRRWRSDEISLVEESAERTWASMERARGEAALRESQTRFQQFADASSGALWIRNASTLNMEFASKAISTVYGVPPESLLSDVKQWASMIVPDDRATALQHIEKARCGESAVHEFRIRRPDGMFRWIRNTDFPLYGSQGEIERIGGIAEDVSEMKRADEHRNILVHELQHRVRNIMAMIRSMASRSAEGASDVEDHRQRFDSRLLAVARVQALLMRDGNQGGSLRQVIESEVHAQAHHAGQLEVTGSDVTISPKAVEVLTLAFHELATNALKYGALSVREGKVTVRWRTFELRGLRWLTLDWTEHGAPPRPVSTRRGFGTELIEARIPYELGGTGKIDYSSDGARCHLEFPLRDAESILETDAPLPTTIFGGSLDMIGAPDLTGQKVLIVEDDYYMAADAAAAFRSAGAQVLGPCATEEATKHLLEIETPTVALLDLNLGGGGPRFELARVLKVRGVPFAFLTGYDPDVIPDELAAVPRMQKPMPLIDVVRAVAELE